jgi:malic enzyme
MISPVQAIAFMIDTKEFSEDYIIPGIFDKIVTAYVASGVEAAAHITGVSRKELS